MTLVADSSILQGEGCVCNFRGGLQDRSLCHKLSPDLSTQRVYYLAASKTVQLTRRKTGPYVTLACLLDSFVGRLKTG